MMPCRIASRVLSLFSRPVLVAALVPSSLGVGDPMHAPSPAALFVIVFIFLPVVFLVLRALWRIGSKK